MKAWLRLTLVTMSVGGGFTGFVGNFLIPSSYYHNPRILLPLFVFAPLYAFITISGLMFVLHPDRTRLLMVAISLQILWISSPLFVYKCFSGFHAVLDFSKRPAGNLGFSVQANAAIGSDWRVGLFDGDPWLIGVNVFALVMLVLLWRSVRTASSPLRGQGPPSR